MPAIKLSTKACAYRLIRWPKLNNRLVTVAWLFTALSIAAPKTWAGEAPPWMRSLTGVSVPAYDEKTNAVLLFSDTSVTVFSENKIKTHVREVYKILRPEGRERGIVVAYFNPGRKISGFHGWCIPANGKDFEVKEKDAIERSAGEGFDVYSDVKYKILQIPAADPGNVIGYEYEIEERPFFLQYVWGFQKLDPARENHFSLELPAGWEYKASWVSYPESKPIQSGNSSQWVVTNVGGIRPEPDMPPWDGVSGQMILSIFPSGGSVRKTEFANWQAMGSWYDHLTNTQMEPSEPMKQEVKTLTAGKSTDLQKMQAVAGFMQHDVRYVEIKLGIGGWQPHTAPSTFSHRYGDCKDKATLMHTMLRELGIESYLVVINTERDSITSDSPAHSAFNHVVLAIRLPAAVEASSLVSVIKHPKLGRLLFFDPTDELTPFGQIRGPLQANYGLLVTTAGGELLALPQQPSAMNSIERHGKMTLDSNGMLKGDVSETRMGDKAATERWRLRTVTNNIDRIKPIELLLAASLPSFQIVRASIANIEHTDQPFGFNYSFQSTNYAKSAGELLLVRPRVLGNKSSRILETKEPRKFPLEFEGPSRDTDSFEIALPPGYEVDELPPPMDVEYSFGSYHSKTEASGQILRYTRAMEIKELSVPVSKMDELKKFYRMIATDERSTAVLKPSPAK